MSSILPPLGSNPLEDSFVTAVEIDDLFGLYTYRLGEVETASPDSRRLFLLYGDNGAGKTTVLQLIFNLLSRARGQGHRGFLARTPFRRLSVRIGADTLVTVEKISPQLVGSYRITVTKEKFEVVSAVITADDENRVAAEQTGLVEYIAVLGDLNLALFFLSDDRKGRSSAETEDGPEEERLLWRMQQEELMRSSRQVLRQEYQPRSEQVLELAISRFAGWVRSQALSGSTAGEVNTNSVYSDIVKRIAKPRRGRPASSERDLSTLLEALKNLEERNKSYAVFGLTSPLSMDAMIVAAGDTPPATKRIVASVLGPYVDGLRARLRALEGVQRLLTTFVDSANSFLYNKTVSFDLRTGLQIRSRNNELLTVRMLSSGERQLLLLLCNTVLARDEASIFLIDEPEISLNIKWQRRLLDALLSLTKDTPVQFIIATHSLELLTRHRGAVRRLGETAVERSQ